MKKEKLLLSNIKQDLSGVAFINVSRAEEWRFSYIIPITLLAIMIGVFLKNVVIGLLIFSVAAYHIVLYIPAHRKYNEQKKALKAALGRGNISISVETLSHIAHETIYEPHLNGGLKRTFRRSTVQELKDITTYYFMSGIGWRAPYVAKHYAWSKEYYVSAEGLENISVEGNEFYYITLQGHHDVAYIYPCKFFELDQSLKNEN